MPSAAWGTKNNAVSLDLRSSFVATRQSANKFAFALAAPKLGRLQEKPYINARVPALLNRCVTGERLRERERERERE